jgi:Holliday junction resolvase
VSGRRGSNRERAVANHLRSDGWIVYRSAGSHGNADLIALKTGYRPRLIQVKSSRRPFEHFRPIERLALQAEAIDADAHAYLVHWPLNKTWTWVLMNGWYAHPEWPRPPSNGTVFDLLEDRP